MKTIFITIILFPVLFCSTLTSSAQYDPDKICRIEDGRLVFSLNLKWSEKEKKEVSELFDLDSLLIARVYGGLSSIVINGENWVVKRTGTNLIELSKPLEPESGKELRSGELFLVIDNWMKFKGSAAETPVIYGTNNFSVPNAFIFTGKAAQFYLPGNQSARKVYISGTFNNWSTTQTPMRRVGEGWMADVKLKPGKYAYKFIIDGRWTTDPGNLLRERGDAGARNSVIYCHNHVFTLKGYKNAHNVVVTGNFLNWNPRGLSMNRSVDGWSLPVYFRDGTYAYKFLVDNQWMTDPGNPVTRKDADGNQNSFLEIGEPYLFKLDGFTTAEKVVLAGSFNHWSENELVMDKTPAGWKLSYVVPAGNYEYKFIADGKWMIDPANPFTSGSGDTQNSFIALKANHIFELQKFPDARNVIVSGSFNGWNTEGYRMARQAGKWLLPVYLPHGKYTYKFIVDGTWMLDPANDLFEPNEYGTDNSILWINPSD